MAPCRRLRSRARGRRGRRAGRRGLRRRPGGGRGGGGAKVSHPAEPADEGPGRRAGPYPAEAAGGQGGDPGVEPVGGGIQRAAEQRAEVGVPPADEVTDGGVQLVCWWWGRRLGNVAEVAARGKDPSAGLSRGGGPGLAGHANAPRSG